MATRQAVATLSGFAAHSLNCQQQQQPTREPNIITISDSDDDTKYPLVGPSAALPSNHNVNLPSPEVITISDSDDDTKCPEMARSAAALLSVASSNSNASDHYVNFSRRPRLSIAPPVLSNLPHRRVSSPPPPPLPLPLNQESAKVKEEEALRGRREPPVILPNLISKQPVQLQQQLSRQLPRPLSAAVPSAAVAVAAAKSSGSPGQPKQPAATFTSTSQQPKASAEQLNPLKSKEEERLIRGPIQLLPSTNRSHIQAAAVQTSSASNNSALSLALNPIPTPIVSISSSSRIYNYKPVAPAAAGRTLPIPTEAAALDDPLAADPRLNLALLSQASVYRAERADKVRLAIPAITLAGRQKRLQKASTSSASSSSLASTLASTSASTLAPALENNKEPAVSPVSTISTAAAPPPPPLGEAPKPEELSLPPLSPKCADDKDADSESSEDELLSLAVKSGTRNQARRSIFAPYKAALMGGGTTSKEEGGSSATSHLALKTAANSFSAERASSPKPVPPPPPSPSPAATRTSSSSSSNMSLCSTTSLAIAAAAGKRPSSSSAAAASAAFRWTANVEENQGRAPLHSASPGGPFPPQQPMRQPPPPPTRSPFEVTAAASSYSPGGYFNNSGSCGGYYQPVGCYQPPPPPPGMWPTSRCTIIPPHLQQPSSSSSSPLYSPNSHSRYGGGGGVYPLVAGQPSYRQPLAPAGFPARPDPALRDPRLNRESLLPPPPPPPPSDQP